jgi:hypothetical protein
LPGPGNSASPADSDFVTWEVPAAWVTFRPVPWRSEVMAKALLWIVAIIFLIGLLVVFGVLDFIF